MGTACMVILATHTRKNDFLSLLGVIHQKKSQIDTLLDVKVRTMLCERSERPMFRFTKTFKFACYQNFQISRCAVIKSSENSNYMALEHLPLTLTHTHLVRDTYFT